MNCERQLHVNDGLGGYIDSGADDGLEASFAELQVVAASRKRDGVSSVGAGGGCGNGGGGEIARTHAGSGDQGAGWIGDGAAQVGGFSRCGDQEGRTGDEDDGENEGLAKLMGKAGEELKVRDGHGLPPYESENDFQFLKCTSLALLCPVT